MRRINRNGRGNDDDDDDDDFDDFDDAPSLIAPVDRPACKATAANANASPPAPHSSSRRAMRRDAESATPRPTPRANDRARVVELAAFAVLALGLALWGYPLGVTAVAAVSPNQLSRSLGVPLDAREVGVIVSAHGVGALLGAVGTVTPASDRRGRRAGVAASARLFVAGSLGMSATPIEWLKRYGGRFGLGERAALRWFVFFRATYGVGCGTCLATTAAYVAEMASVRRRGTLLVCMSAVEIVGELMGDFLGLAVERAPGAWRALLALPIPVALAYGWLARMIPESPRWCVLKATNEAMRRRETRGEPSDSWTYEELDLAEARAAESVLRNERATTIAATDVCVRRSKDGGGLSELFRVPERGILSEAMKSDIERELREISDVIRSQRATSTTCASVVNAPSTRRAMTVAFGLSILSALSGAPALTFFAKHVFEMTGHTPTIASSMTTALALAKLLATAFVALTLERVGRRPMLLTGVFMQLGAIGVLACVFDGIEWIEDPRAAASFQLLGGFVARVADACVVTAAIGHALSFWCLAGTVSNEISPIRARAMVLGFTSAFAWTLQTLAVRFFPIMMRRPGPSHVLGFFACVNAFACFFIWRHVPETRGRSLEEIERAMCEESSLVDVARRLARPRGDDDDDERAPLVAPDRRQLTITGTERRRPRA